MQEWYLNIVTQNGKTQIYVDKLKYKENKLIFNKPQKWSGKTHSDKL